MIFFALYLAVCLPAVYATRQLRSLRGARMGYLKFMLGLFGGLFLLGFVMAPVAGLGLLGLLAVAAKHTVQEVRYRHRQVQYLRGNGPAPVQP